MVASPSERSTLSCRVIRSLLIYFKEQYGAARLDKALQSADLPAGIDEAFFDDQERWLDAEVALRLIDTLAEAANDPLFARLAGRRTVARDVLGRLYTVMRAFGSTMLCYSKAAELSHLYNRAGTFSCRALGKRKVEVTYRAAQRESARNACQLRIGQFEAF